MFLERFCTQNRLNILKSSNLYVEPEEKSSGYKWIKVFDKEKEVTVSETVQTTFQFISIIKTLKSLFSDPEFERFYLHYNRDKDHNCDDGSFKGFRCGSIYKNSEFFQNNPLAIQIRLFTDEFEPCDPLKSKVGVHKINSFYFQINNLPSKFLSKLRSIHLVALCDASDSKYELSNADNVIETIVNDLRQLERVGIKTVSGISLKGTLATVLFDNLGGNVLYGLSGGFGATYFCRICEMKRTECHSAIKEERNLLRNEKEYNAMIQKIQEDCISDLVATKGVHKYCHLNDLDHFHMLRNLSGDIMHDIFEGIASFLLEALFEYCFEKRLFSVTKLQNMIAGYIYGPLSKKNIPSKCRIDKKNLGQNATQMQCLLFHIPFILSRYRASLENVWICVESLLQIIQIVMSSTIDNQDIERLSNLIEIHLSSYMDIFKKHLKPKHHIITHYPTIIRRVGPIINLWTKRMEGKHQIFKRAARSTRNFINLKKTLAMKHQENASAEAFDLSDNVKISEISTPFEECEDFEKFREQMIEIGLTNDFISKCKVVKFLEINDRKYKQGLLILHDKIFLEINHILISESNFHFLCSISYNAKYYDKFLNGVELHKNKEDVHFVNVNDSYIGKPMEKKYFDERFFVIANSLEIFRLVKNN